MAISRGIWALLAICSLSLATYLPTEHLASLNGALEERDVLSFGMTTVDARSPKAALLAPQTNSDGTTPCDANNPCTVGCCGNGGIAGNAFICGTGPTFCAAGNCTGTCDYRAQCNPGGWAPQYWNASTCPLNVCCSPFGSCGTTSDFCGGATVPQPSCSSSVPGSTVGRRVAYYEGWIADRPCDPMLPTQVPLGLWTHINIAFASVDPNTFEVVYMDGVSGDVITQIASLKEADPELSIYLSIGGWSFNDPGPTQATFSDLAASESARETFFASLISFMLNNGLNGVDIDWEYPGASDRGGNPADYVNFPKFLQNLRAAMNKSGYLFGLTVTAPSSYWYLQNFDIATMSQTIDWFNVMTYDLHGTWDGNDPFIGPVALAHTSLTEIKETMDLFWRNNIDPSRITLGLGFYGRSFTMTDPNCLSAGCPFSGGANPGPCTQNSGTLSAEEIRDIIGAGGATVTLDATAAVEIVTWDNDQWVSYDDQPTFQMKLEWANSVCLGGVMVWAVDLDDIQGTSANELAVALGLPANSSPPLFLVLDPDIDTAADIWFLLS